MGARRHPLCWWRRGFCQEQRTRNLARGYGSHIAEVSGAEKKNFTDTSAAESSNQRTETQMRFIQPFDGHLCYAVAMSADVKARHVRRMNDCQQ